MKSELRKIIKEEVAKILDEDYDSYNELEDFAVDLIHYFAKVNFEIANEFAKEKNTILPEFKAVLLKEVYQSINKKYNKIGNFLDDTNISYIVDSKGVDNKSIKGSYDFFTGGYEPNLFREIQMFYGYEFFSRFKEKAEKDSFSEFDFYSLLYYEFHRPTLHELQHAYDDYRSKSKIYASKEFDSYMKSIKSKSQGQVLDSDVNAAKKYLRLPHEIWARFSETIKKINFRTGDIRFEKDGAYFHYKMIPLKDVARDFIRNFRGWSVIGKNYEDGTFNPSVNLTHDMSKMQKRLLKAVVQFWHKEQEKTERENKNPEIVKEEFLSIKKNFLKT